MPRAASAACGSCNRSGSELSNAPTALSVVGLAWSLPMLVFLLVGGAASDRFDRRLVLIVADVVRGLAIGAVGVLSVTGSLELWHVIVLVALEAAGQSLFGPAFGAIVPDLVPEEMLVQANSLNQFMEPSASASPGPRSAAWPSRCSAPGRRFS